MLHLQTYRALAKAAAPLVPSFPVSELITLLFTLSKAGVHDSCLLAAAATRALPSLHQLTAKELSILATAFADAGVVHEMLLEGIAANAIEPHRESHSQLHQRCTTTFPLCTAYASQLTTPCIAPLVFLITAR